MLIEIWTMTEMMMMMTNNDKEILSSLLYSILCRVTQPVPHGVLCDKYKEWLSGGN